MFYREKNIIASLAHIHIGYRYTAAFSHKSSGARRKRYTGRRMQSSHTRSENGAIIYIGTRSGEKGNHFSFSTQGGFDWRNMIFIIFSLAQAKKLQFFTYEIA